jgi:hypothetical protein
VFQFITHPLQHDAGVLLLLFGRDQRRTGRMLEYLPYALTRPGRTFQIIIRSNPRSHLLTFFHRHGTLANTAEFFNGTRIVSQILFASDEDDGQVLAKVQHF